MTKISAGMKVRKKGAHQTMEVVGPAGLAATSAARIPASARDLVMCRWTNAKGKTIQRSFAAADLQEAPDE